MVMQARPTKAADFRGLDNAEILQKVAELKRESMRLEYMQRTRGNLVNPGAVSIVWLIAFISMRQRLAQGTHACPPPAADSTQL